MRAAAITTILLVLLYAHIFIITNALNVRPYVIQQYFQSFNIKSITILTCSDGGTKSKLLRHMSSTGFSVSFSQKRVLGHREARIGAVLDLNCDFSRPFIDKLTKLRAMGQHTEWLLIDRVNNTDIFQNTPGVDILKDAYIFPGSCVTLAQVSHSEISYYDMFRVSMFTPMKYQLMTKQSSNEFKAQAQRFKRDNLDGITLATAGVMFDPNHFEGLDTVSHNNIEIQVNFPLVVCLMDQLNFSITARVFTDYGWARNGNYTGIVGLLQRYEVDLAINGMYITKERMPVIDYTGETVEFRSRFVFRKPALSSIANIYTLPFSRAVWISCYFVTAITVIILIIEKCLPIRKRQVIYQTVTTPEIVSAVIGCITQQGYNLIPKSSSGKGIIFIFSLGVFVLYIAYSAYIVSLLQSTSQKLKTVYDLIDSPLQVSVQDVPYFKYFVGDITSDDKLFGLKKKIIHQGAHMYTTAEEGMKKVREELHAFLVVSHKSNLLIADTFDEREKCTLEEIFPFYSTILSFPVPENSGLRDLFTVKFAKQKEVGIHRRIYTNWHEKNWQQECHSHFFINVGILDLKPSYIILAYGSLISLALFLMEIIYKYILIPVKKSKKKIQWLNVLQR